MHGESDVIKEKGRQIPAQQEQKVKEKKMHGEHDNKREAKNKEGARWER